jgi:hypothetical protein
MPLFLVADPAESTGLISAMAAYHLFNKSKTLQPPELFND